jgi:hypothetical protein
VVIPDGGLTIPGYVDANGQAKKITDLRQLQLEDTLVRLGGIAENDQQPNPINTTLPLRRLPAYVAGTYFLNQNGEYANYTGSTNDPSFSTQPYQPWQQPHVSIDAEHRMVVFDKAVYKNAYDTIELYAVPADLTLVTCVTILEPDTYAPTREVYLRSGPGEVETGILWIEHPEIIFEYENGVWTAATAKYARQEAQYYADAAYERLQTFTAQTATYQGLVPIPLDGAIRQLTYVIGRGGVTTSISRNTEQYPVVIPWQQRRAWEKQREAERQQALKDGDQQVAMR